MPTIDVKAAVGAAIDYLTFLRDKISTELQNVRLEEVELTDDKKYWLITLGYDVPKHQTPFERMVPSISPSYDREYKLFKINSESSQVEAMTIRKV